MATSYPGGLDAFTNPTATDSLASASVPHATQHANANDAIEAIEAELGTNPKGSAASVKARFDAIEAAGWVTSTRILDGTIVNGDISGSAAIDPAKINGTAVVTGDSRLSDSRTPTAHKTSHATGGSDAIAPADIGAAPAASPTFTGTVTTPLTTAGYVKTDSGGVLSSSAAIAQADVTNLTSDLAAKTDDVDLPHTAIIPGVVLPNASSGLNTQAYAGASYFNCLAYTNNTQNCYLEWTVFLAAGTYTLRTLHRSNTDFGILSISVDGGAALGTTVDGYAASVTSNNITDITGVALTAGRHTIRYTAATKNASSTGYRIGIHGITLTRTGA